MGTESIHTPQTARMGLTALVVLGLCLDLAWATSAAPQSAPAGRLPTLFVIGDSTVNTGTKGQQGWGTPLVELFDKTKIKVENRARGGRSSRTFQTEGLWDKIVAALQPGDFVLMQFGHNDGGPVTQGRARASLKGTGEETLVVVDDKTGKKEVVHTYGWYMRKYVAYTRARGATPIVLSPIPRNIWKDNRVVRASKDYGKWAAEAAKAEGAFFIDLNELVAQRYEAVGAEKVKALYFSTDHTHTSVAGARLNAGVVVEGLKGLKECPLCRFLAAAPAVPDNPKVEEKK
jgi:lysophospholipase L1-like esterase